MAVHYIFPGTGTTPATAAQAQGVRRQLATVDLLTTDTTFTITHNAHLDTAQLTLLTPLFHVRPVGSAAGTFSLGSRTTDTVVVDAAVTVAGVFEVELDFRHSILMPTNL